MNNIIQGKYGCSAIIMLVLLFVPAFSSHCAENEIEKNKPALRLAIVPFQKVLPDTGTSNTAVCPLCGSVYFGGKVEQDGEKIVEELFIEKLKDFKEIEIIQEDKVEGIYKRISSESLKMPLLTILKKTGAELDADIIAVGYVFRYVERIGYNYSAEKPASVAFEINFINPQDGSIIWRGIFDKTQKSLMEDVLQIASFYQGGGKWLTARELAKQGVTQAFKKFPGFEH